MLELKISLENVDYMTVIKSLIPLVIKNKLMAGAAVTAANMKLRSMSQAEQEKFVADFLSDHEEKVKELLNSAVKNKGINGNVSDFSAETK